MEKVLVTIHNRRRLRMRKVLIALLMVVVTTAFAFLLITTASVASADQLKVTVDVSAGNRSTEIVGADIYANIDGKLTEISVTPDGDVPFKMNLKTGALRIKSFWHTRAQLNGKDKPEVESK